jgi:uncharacterized membrane protein YjgN (DUF898 family)
MPPQLEHRLSFHGTGGALFGIHLVTVLLSVVTLGIYSFWGRTKARQYLWSQTAFAGDRFAYHGTGGELFRGYLKAMGILLLLYIVTLVLVPLVFRPLLGDAGGAILGVAVMAGGFMVLIPAALIGARRYRASRTSWRGIRFSFTGRVGEFVKLYLGGALLSIVTLTLYSPYFHADVRRFNVTGTRFGTATAAFDGRGADLFRRYLLGLVLTIPTLGLYWFWYAAERERYYWSRTTADGATFRATVTGGGLLGLAALSVLLLVVTLGLGLPWVVVRMQRYLCDHLVLEGSLDLAGIEQRAQAASATGEGLSTALDVDGFDAGFGV